MLIGHSVSDSAGRLLAVDPAVCEILQRTEMEIRGMSYLDLTHRDDRAFNGAAVDGLGVHEGPIRIRKRYVRPDGSSACCDVEVSRLATGGRGSLVGTVTLVTPGIGIRTPETLWQSAVRIHALIQRRRATLGDDLFADHAWIILLQIYLAEAEGRISDGASIGERARLSSPLVSRWLRALAQKGLIELSPCATLPAQMTATGIAQMERLLDWTLDLVPAAAADDPARRRD